MLPGLSSGEDVRFFTPDSLEAYAAETVWNHSVVTKQQALEETFFLGLRLTSGVRIDELKGRFGDAVSLHMQSIAELNDLHLLEQKDGLIRLTPQGRLLSNEVFERFLA